MEEIMLEIPDRTVEMPFLAAAMAIRPVKRRAAIETSPRPVRVALPARIMPALTMPRLHRARGQTTGRRRPYRFDSLAHGRQM